MNLLWQLAQIKIPTTNNGQQVIPVVNLTPTTLQGVLSAVFLVIGGLSTLFILVGAARYAASDGDQGKITEAKNTILYAAVGIVISLSAFTIVQFVVGKL